ncbi:unannotated protein [freshwater metagenome]|uniref:Unannotated protein n=1 Tax=freshwater metagenome TaxID=449393 RepID=A0A6J7DCM6_9ZZZZ
MAKSSGTLYHDRSVTLTQNFLNLRGVSRILGRSETIEFPQIVAFRLRDAREYPFERVPAWGISDDNVWFTKDSQRWRRRQAIELVLHDGRALGFTPAHGSRVAEILVSRGVSQLT